MLSQTLSKYTPLQLLMFISILSEAPLVVNRCLKSSLKLSRDTAQISVEIQFQRVGY